MTNEPTNIEVPVATVETVPPVVGNVDQPPVAEVPVVEPIKEPQEVKQIATFVDLNRRWTPAQIQEVVGEGVKPLLNHLDGKSVHIVRNAKGALVFPFDFDGPTFQLGIDEPLDEAVERSLNPQ